MLWSNFHAGSMMLLLKYELLGFFFLFLLKWFGELLCASLSAWWFGNTIQLNAKILMSVSGKRLSQVTVKQGIPIVIHSAMRVSVISYGGGTELPQKREGLSKIVSGISMTDWATSIASILKEQLHMEEFLSWIRCVFHCLILFSRTLYLSSASFLLFVMLTK